jgi:hypothetical protein
MKILHSKERRTTSTEDFGSYVPIMDVELGAEEFIELMENKRHSIKSFSVVVPRLGENKIPFGRFRVEFVNPLLRLDSDGEEE